MGRRKGNRGKSVLPLWSTSYPLLLYLHHSHKSIGQCRKDSAVLSGCQVQDGVIQLHRPQLLPVEVRRRGRGRRGGGGGRRKVGGGRKKERGEDVICMHRAYCTESSATMHVTDVRYRMLVHLVLQSIACMMKSSVPSRVMSLEMW